MYVYCTHIITNPRHACAVRVTVLGLCVCLSIISYLPSRAITRQASDTNGFIMTWAVKVKRSFLFKCLKSLPLSRCSTYSFECDEYSDGGEDVVD